MASIINKVRDFIEALQTQPVTLGAYGAACFLIGAFFF